MQTCDMNQINDVNRAMIIRNCDIAPTWDNPQIIRMLDSDRSLVGKMQRIGLKGSLLLRFLDLLGSHNRNPTREVCFVEAG